MKTHDHPDSSNHDAEIIGSCYHAKACFSERFYFYVYLLNLFLLPYDYFSTIFQILYFFKMIVSNVFFLAFKCNFLIICID